MRNDYNEIDRAIMECIKDGVNKFNLIQTRLDNMIDGDWRIIDRRLQSLRKRRHIAYEPKTNWYIPEWARLFKA